MPAHHVSRAGEAPPSTPVAFEGRSTGYGQVVHVDGRFGAVHAAVATAALQPGGSVAPHLQSYEEYLFILDGSLELTLNGRTFTLAANDCACVPVGATHALRNAGASTCRWIDFKAPIPRTPDRPADTFFVQAAGDLSGSLRDPGAPHFNTYRPDGMSLEALVDATRPGGPPGNPNLGNALQVFGGTTLKMLLDHRQGAFLGNMFMIQFQPGMVLQSHDHPLEEIFYMLEGEVRFIADGREYRLRTGDVAFAGVGCIHEFANQTECPCRWLETRSPLPPVLHEARFGKDWNDVASRVVGATRS